MLVTCFCVIFFSIFDPKGAVAAMAVIRGLTLVWMVHRTAATVATTLSNCQSACNLGEMLCLNKNASSTLCSAVQGACMAGCYASRVDCGCADDSYTHCAKEFALRHLSAEVLVSLVASLSALMVVVLGKRCGRRMEWPRIRLPSAGRANRDDLLLDLELPLLLSEDYAPAPPASPPALLLPETRDRASSI